MPLAEPKVWIVIDSDGVRHFLEKEPLEGLVKWIGRQKVTVLEYDFGRIAYPVKKEGER